MKRRNQEFFVKSAEIIYCPCCNSELAVIGSRKRKYFNSTGVSQTLIIRRLRCTFCKKIHHELPDILVPYKRYDSESIESVLSSEQKLTVAADESTISRWRRWFSENVEYFQRVLITVKLRLNYEAEEKELSRIPGTALSGILHIIGDSSGWLAKVVRVVANTNLWLHTRSAFLSTW